MRNLLLIPLLLLGACTKEESSTPVIEMQAVTPPPAVTTDTTPANANGATPAANETGKVSENAKAQAAAAMNDRSISDGSKPLIPVQQPANQQKPAYTPKRTPEFGFAADGSITQAQLADYYVEMTCSLDGKEVGTIVFEMWPQFAPGTVRNFLRYCDEGFYDGLGFHRIARTFMLQGGDPKGDGSGDGPHGSIRAEFSDEPARKHGYGVLSMARGGNPNSASSQFFLCCDESMDVWNLDGKYASFGKMVSGVAALEAMANVPVGGPQRTSPMLTVKIAKAVVKKGVAPKSNEKMERPQPDLKGEAAKITVQHILVSFKETEVKADRTKEAAEKLANELIKRARDGEDFSALVREYSDDNLIPGDDLPGSYLMVNKGVTDYAFNRARFNVRDKEQALYTELGTKINAKQITLDQGKATFREFQMKHYGPQPIPREQMVSSFGDVSFSLKVGEIGMAEYSPTGSRYGWHIIRRVN
jgi:peptidyl-prolyl cis-trans isomerase B (cyclophilin B)